MIEISFALNVIKQYPKFESKEEMSEITSGKRFKFVSSEKLSDFIYWTPGIVKAIVFRDPIDRAISSFEYEQWHEKKVSSILYAKFMLVSARRQVESATLLVCCVIRAGRPFKELEGLRVARHQGGARALCTQLADGCCPWIRLRRPSSGGNG